MKGMVSMLKISVCESADGLDRRGVKRSPATYPEHRRGRPAANRGERLPAEPLSAEEVFALLERCRGVTARRNRALIMLLWRSGLRCAEALALHPKDVDLERGEVAVLHGKGNRRRVVAIDQATCGTVGLWIAHRHELGLKRNAPLFCVIVGPSAGAGLYGGYVRDMLARLGREAEIGKRVHPHGLRHTYAAHLLEEGLPISYIRRMLGHASLLITERYCDHLSPFEALERVRAVPWPTPERTVEEIRGAEVGIAVTSRALSSTGGGRLRVAYR